MNISYNWLKDYLNINLEPEQVAAALTSIGLETGGIEEVQTIKGGLEGLVIGEVLTCIDHPNSDHLRVTTVNLGDGQPTQIVCGAANVAAGQKVVVATVGATLYSGDDSFSIKKSKIRGEESFGMICAEDEIGIGSSHEGIIVLPAEAVPGTLAKDYYNIKSDYVFEVDITPNRVDAASHYGVARDLAAYLKQTGEKVKLELPSVDAFKVENQFGAIDVEVRNTEACPRYCGLTIKGVTVKDSPEWLQNRLTTIGLRPINNVVDVTNYVLHETGQPLHAFDAQYITNNKVIVTTVEQGTRFVTLDDVTRELDQNDLMICNEEEGMCLAGVFGGQRSGVSDITKDIFLECAYFNPTWIRKAARRHGLNTDSSFRFERGVDPNNLEYVIKRAALLIKELAGGEITGDIFDYYPVKIERPRVELSFDKVNSLIGNEIPKETVKSILKSLEIEIVQENKTGLILSIPTYRVDVYRDVDVIEDILRIFGYNNIDFSEQVKSNLSYKSATDRSYQLQNVVAEQLTGSGFNEIMNNSLTHAAYYSELTTMPEANCVKLINPLSTDLNVMRQSLLFGGLESIAYNINRRQSNIKFYEFGNCYYFQEKYKKADEILAPYNEEYHLGLWLTGNRVSGSWAHADEQSTVYELKAYVKNIFLRLGLDTNKIVHTQYSDEIYSVGLALTTQIGRSLGSLGIVSNKVLKRFEIEQEVYFADLNWTNIMREIEKVSVTFTEISKFPPVKRDLALLVDLNVQFAQIEKIAFDTERKLLKDVYLFDVYEGKNLEAGKKSYAVSFILQDENKTLNDKQIEGVMKRLLMNFEQKFGAKLR